MKANYAYPGRFLFTRGHCVVHAWAHVAGLDAEGAKLLAEYAYATPSWHRPRRGVRHVVPHPDFGDVEPLLDPTTGAGWTRGNPHVHLWAKLVGMRVLCQITPGGKRVTRVNKWGERRERFYPMTVSQFAKSKPIGRFILCVAGHALALIDGVLWGDWAPRSRVEVAYQVEAL